MMRGKADLQESALIIMNVRPALAILTALAGTGNVKTSQQVS